MSSRIQPFEYTADVIVKKSAGAKTIALVSSDKRTDKTLEKTAQALCEYMKSEGINAAVSNGEDMTELAGKHDKIIVYASDALHDIKALKTATACDCSVIVVSYRYTQNETLTQMKSALSLHKSELLGVIAGK